MTKEDFRLIYLKNHLGVELAVYAEQFPNQYRKHRLGFCRFIQLGANSWTFEWEHIIQDLKPEELEPVDEYTVEDLGHNWY